jgi:hypothetical protein
MEHELPESGDRDWIFPLVVSVIILAASFYSWANTDFETLQRCRSIARDDARLACYDEATAPKVPAKGGLAPSLQHPPGGTGS